MLENLRISDIAVHEVFKRGEDRRIRQPDYAQHVENLSVEATTAFRLRVTDALSAKAKAVEMDILQTGPGTFQGDARALLSAVTEEEFLTRSRAFADRLASAQMHQNIPGGIVVVFRGTTGRSNDPFVGVIKAEVQEGFRRSRVDGVLTTEFVNDLFMTKATRLYKIGFMTGGAGRIDDDTSWRALVFDHYIVASNREAAAIYFYEGFLGCGFKEDSAYETSKFFNLTREFASKKIDDRQTRHDLNDSLYTYVKNDQAPTFTVAEFAERHVPVNLRDEYQAFMEAKQFPTRAVRRDTADLKGRLKRRRFKYQNDIEFSAPPDAIADGLVSIEGGRLDGEDRAEVTTITIRTQFVKET